MHSIKNLQEIIIKAIHQHSYPQEPKELYEPISYFMDLGGKRLRPVLLLLAADLYKVDLEKAIKPALAIELFHNFTLMHDDIMDKAPLRRGKDTVHKKWNDSVAILSGDVMLIEAYKLMMQVNPKILPEVLNIFNTTAIEVCEGQQFDMNFENQQQVDVSDYIEMIRLKTAVLLGASLKIGALIGQASTDDAQHIYDFGINIGIAFQLKDDLLDVYGNPEKFGKQIGGDILSNKKTFLLIKALELANIEQKTNLNNWLNADNFISKDKIEAITDLYNQLDIKTITEEKIINYADLAFSSLQKIDQPEDRKSTLKEFMDLLMLREY
jgi:geranylgeranyl diphosphate synthase type II